MKTTMAILILATTANAGHIFELRISDVNFGTLDTTPENPFDPLQFNNINITETFWADAQPFQLDILKWDYVADDGTLLASVAPYMVSLPILVSSGMLLDQYFTTEDSPTPWGDDVRWQYDNFPRSPDALRWSPAGPGGFLTQFEVTKPNGLYFVNVSNAFQAIPEPAAHILLVLVGVLAWCLARRGRA